MNHSSWSVRVPASSANLGPGLDTFGLALGLYHELEVTPLPTSSREPSIELTSLGEGAASLPAGEDNAVVKALRAALRAGGYDGPDLRLQSNNAIPLARGLGSSAAAFVAGSAAGQLLSGGRVDDRKLLAAGLAWEGHADNVAPCIHGGFTVVTTGDGGVRCARFDPPGDLQAVVGVPDFELSTRDSRGDLPPSVSRADAVHAVSRAGLVAAALASGRLELLGAGMEDERLHEPYRVGRVPGLRAVQQAARAAGAYGAALSGAGPSILALTPARAVTAVEQAVAAAWTTAGVRCRVLTLSVDAEGLRAQARSGERT